jgi:carbon-monoxide dehydrogenase iron sulfur subunit
MSDQRKVTRREFVRDFAVITGGAAVGVGLSKDALAEVQVIKEIPKAGVVVHDPSLCRGCKICEVACSASHDGECSSYLSRIHIKPNDLDLVFSGLVCSQCESPSCYFACPKKDQALCIDKETGARYINQDECLGCGQCIEACPLPEAPIWLKTVKGREVAFKCDLCRGRAAGPICVELCPRKALTFEERRD